VVTLECQSQSVASSEVQALQHASVSFLMCSWLTTFLKAITN